MRWITPILVLAAVSFADDAPVKKKNAVPAAPIVQKPVVAADDAAAEYKELVAAYNRAQNEFYKEYREKRKADPNYRYDRANHPQNEFRAKFEALAKKTAGTDTAVDAWIMYARCNGKGNHVAETLLRDHIDSEKLADALYLLPGEATLQKVIEATPHRKVKGTAYFLLAQRIQRSDGFKKAESIYELCCKEYADVPLWGGRTTVKKRAEGCLFEARNLAVGMEAPDIEGEDIDGVAFKLSDYRGKVIVLDFWGDW